MEAENADVAVMDGLICRMIPIVPDMLEVELIVTPDTPTRAILRPPVIAEVETIVTWLEVVNPNSEVATIGSGMICCVATHPPKLVKNV